MATKKAYIQSIASYLPKQRLTNEDLAALYPDWNVEKIFDKTGISVRAVAASNETAGDMAFNAAERLFEKGVCKREDIEFLLLITQSPDFFLPTTACILQDRLGLSTSCGALDINLGCSGFIYGLALVKGMIESGLVKNALLLTSETYTKYIHPSDRGVRTIFGDGAAATFISSVESEDDLIGPFILGTDGSGAEELIVRMGAHRMSLSCTHEPSVFAQNDNMPTAANLYMAGPEIFNFTLKVVPVAVQSLLEKAGKRLEEIDYYVFHQANKFMLDRLRKKIKIPEEKFCINNQDYANTVSATIPMALEIEFDKGTLKKDDSVMLVGFGVGLSWGAVLMKVR